jgi:hypothetical protein
MIALHRYCARGLLVATLGAATSASGQNSASYQPGQRLRTALDTCQKNEVIEGSYCIQKCQPGFRLDLVRDKPPSCVSLGGRVVSAISSPAVRPVWTPPPKDSSPPRPES